MQQTITQAQARALAVRYEAFCEANTRGDIPARNTWGAMLAATQAQIGVELIPAHMLPDASAVIAAEAVIAADAAAEQSTPGIRW